MNIFNTSSLPTNDKGPSTSISMNLKGESFESKREKYMVDIRRKKRENILLKKRQQPSIFGNNSENDNNNQIGDNFELITFAHLENHPNKSLLIEKIKEFSTIYADIENLEEICENLNSNDM